MAAPEGSIAIAEALKVNKTLTNIKCAASPHRAHRECFTPLGPVDVSLSALRSLSQNALCGIGNYGLGTYTAEGIIQMAEALKVNKTLQGIEYVAESNWSAVLPVRAR